MPSIKVKSIEPITVGMILKQLIAEKGFKSQKEFVDKFNNWLLNSEHEKQPPITEKDLSRWVKGTVTPRESKLELFADYFNVNLEYLQCKKQIRHPRTIQTKKTFEILDALPDSKLIESIAFESHFSLLKAYCESLGYKFEYHTTSSQEIVYETEVIQDGKLYHLEIADDAADNVETVITFPDGSVITPTDEQLNDFIDNVNHVLEFEFSKLKKGKGK